MATLHYVGDVRNVIDGIVPAELAHTAVDARSFHCAFEAGSPRSLASMGELVAFNGVAYAKSTDAGNVDEYYRLVHGSEFYTTGVLMVPHNTPPHSRFVREFAQPVTVNELYGELLALVGQPVCVAGLVEFAVLDATAITKAPIDGKNIFAHTSEFYSRGHSLGRTNVHAALVGAATDFHDARFVGVNRELERVLYNNPFEQSAQLNTHSHILELSAPLASLADVDPSHARDVWHVIASSRIAKVNLDVYAVSHLQPHPSQP